LFVQDLLSGGGKSTTHRGTSERAHHIAS
jgi:hypothetical protein